MVRLTRRRAITILTAPALTAGLRTLSAGAAAEPYPVKPIRIIVPYPAGGPYDAIPRIIAQWIGAQQGWSLVIDNRPGATGIIGVMAAKQAAPDGHTLVVATTSTHGSMPALKRHLAYDAVTDFAPVVLLADATLVLLVRDELPVRSVAQLVEMLRSKPGQLNFSTGGYGSPHHLATMTLFHRAGLPQNAAVHVPFAGLAPALTALLSGNVQFMITSTGAATPHIASGKLRALATTSLERSPRLPDVPTMAELGYPGFHVVAWCGLAAPAQTPEAIVLRWSELANAALNDPALREQISKLDYDVRGGTPAAFARFLTLDIGRYKKLAEDMGLAED
ncbi:MAG TPA: tripartite tricarboxylate transporter substrate binding protein [Xanthobacteraceae bacterium]